MLLKGIFNAAIQVAVVIYRGDDVHSLDTLLAPSDELEKRTSDLLLVWLS